MIRRFARWVEARRWAANVSRARTFRQGLAFSERRIFDMAMRPPIHSDRSLVIEYPDAFYHVTIIDVARAMNAVHKFRHQTGARP